jgi:hypothetical protein
MRVCTCGLTRRALRTSIRLIHLAIAVIVEAIAAYFGTSRRAAARRGPAAIAAASQRASGANTQRPVELPAGRSVTGNALTAAVENPIAVGIIIADRAEVRRERRD